MWQTLILGIIQGVTEFLPISSSGHLILVPKILGWAEPGLAFDALLHLATGLAVVVFFRKEIGIIISDLWSKDKQRRVKSGRLCALIFAAALPASLIGWRWQAEIENNWRGVTVVAWALIIGALFLGWAERYISKAADRTEGLKNISWRQGLVVGLSQVLALIPGVSRSGATITGGLLTKINRETAVSFSFLVGLPATLGAGLWGLLKILPKGGMGLSLMTIFGSFGGALVAGLAALKLLVWLARRADFKIFVIYRIFLGLILLWVF